MNRPAPASSAVATRPRKSWRHRLRLVVLSILLACFTFLVFGATLLITMPASVASGFLQIPPQVTHLYSSLWHGRAGIVGGYTLDWQLRGWPLLTGRGVVDWSIQGGDTQLTGVGTLTPWSARGTDIVGRAGAGLLALAPNPMLQNCTSRAVVDVQALEWRRGAASAAGVILIDAGRCEDVLGNPANIPQLTLDLSTQGNDARADLRDRDGRLAQATITGDRRLILRIEPEGAAMIPGLPTGGPMIIEYPF